ncbi:MAG: hypothetical protein KKB21_04670 [Nanoarchaeota archaeon]|nr:hypothetical protein [Nanoarchaeota archaeon]
MISLHDPRYERAESQEFGNFSEGDRFLRDYCGNCRRHDRCLARKGLCGAIGEDYPYWHSWFVRRDLKSDLWTDWLDMTAEEQRERPDRIISCNRFIQKPAKSS